MTRSITTLVPINQLICCYPKCKVRIENQDQNGCVKSSEIIKCKRNNCNNCIHLLCLNVWHEECWIHARSRRAADSCEVEQSIVETESTSEKSKSESKEAEIEETAEETKPGSPEATVAEVEQSIEETESTSEESKSESPEAEIEETAEETKPGSPEATVAEELKSCIAGHG